MPRLLNWPRSMNALIVGLGLALILFHSPEWLPQGGAGAVTVTSHGLTTVTTTDTVERKVRGRIVHREEKVYVRVPLIVVHTDDHTIKVKAHLLPLAAANATVARPFVTVHIPVPMTVFVPTTLYATVTSTVTTTELVPTTITVTLPLTDGG